MVFLFKHFEVALYTASSFQKLGSISTNWNCRLCVEPTSKLARNPPKQLNVTSNRNHVQHYYYRDVLFASIFYWEIAVFREQGHRKLGVFLVSGLFFKFTFFFFCVHPFYLYEWKLLFLFRSRMVSFCYINKWQPDGVINNLWTLDIDFSSVLIGNYTLVASRNNWSNLIA